MGGARRVLDEDRLARIRLVDARHVIDGVVRHRGDEVPRAGRLAFERVDLRGAAEEVGLPLVGVAADEAVEVLEAHPGGPLVEGTDLARRERGRVVVLAEPRRRVAVVEEHAADRRLVAADDAVVAGKARRLLGDHAEARRVVVAAGDERGARGRAQGGREHAVVAQALAGDAVHRRRGITPPNVLGTPNPASSVMTSRTLGAPLGGTTRGAHHGFDCNASSLMTPPNGGRAAATGAGLTVVVADGEPATP